METIHLAIIEDDPVIRESLETYLSANPTIQIKVAANSVESFLEELSGMYQPEIDTMILDIGLPGMTGIQGIYHIKKEIPDLDILMLTTFEEEEKIFDALCAGACSYLSKRTPLAKIMEAVFTVHRGGSYMSPVIARKVAQYFKPKPSLNIKKPLTDRQNQIVDGIKEGLSYKEIAAKLGISVDTVRDHIKKIYKLLEVNSKAELIKKVLGG